MVNEPRIVTNRLTLRLAGASDVPALLSYFTDNAAHLAPTSPLLPPEFLTEPYWQAQIARNQEEFAAGRSVRLFLFPCDEPDTVIGNLSLNTIVRGAAHYCDLGYSLASNRQGQGLMSEAVAAAIRYAFEELRLHRVKAAYLPTNERSARLLRRLGFVVEGYARDYLRIQGRWQDQVLVGIINQELARRLQAVAKPPYAPGPAQDERTNRRQRRLTSGHPPPIVSPCPKRGSRLDAGDRRWSGS